MQRRSASFTWLFLSGFASEIRESDTDEPTQRSRGFVFQVLGAVTALMAGAKELYVYENGVGAISLPYTAAQVGAHNTRATSPLFLAGMSEFISTVVGHQFEIRNPYLFRTKGQMCEALRGSRLRDLIRLTGSCDGFLLLRRAERGPLWPLHIMSASAASPARGRSGGRGAGYTLSARPHGYAPRCNRLSQSERACVAMAGDGSPSSASSAGAGHA